MVDIWTSEDNSDMKNKIFNESNRYKVPMDDKSFYKMDSNDLTDSQKAAAIGIKILCYIFNYSYQNLNISEISSPVIFDGSYIEIPPNGMPISQKCQKHLWHIIA